MPPKRKSKKHPRQQRIAPEDLIDEFQRDEIIKVFNDALEKGAKTLSISKSKRIFKILGIDAKTDELESFLVNDEALDLDQSLFLHFAALKIIQMEKANQAFDLIDKDKKGIVVLEDLQRVAQELGEEFSQEELTEMIELADRSGDGLLQSKDFVRIARKIKL